MSNCKNCELPVTEMKTFAAFKGQETEVILVHTETRSPYCYNSTKAELGD
jgi:hypothetical protein